MQKVCVLPGQKFGFSEISAKYVTCDNPNFAIDGMICKLVQQITTNQADLDLSEIPNKVILQQSCQKKW
jgi:hypothetical protein